MSFLFPLQVQLYEDFAKSRAKASVEDSITSVSAEEEEKPKLKATGHVFQVHWFYSILCRNKMEIHRYNYYTQSTILNICLNFNPFENAHC